MTVLPRTRAAIERGIADGLHPGAQLFVSLDGKTVADEALGEARPGVAMTTSSLNTWFSTTKLVTSLLAVRAWEQGAFALDDPVSAHLPEIRGGGKEAITVRHLFTHTAGLRVAERRAGGALAPWDDMLAAIASSEVEEGWVPGRRAAYHGGSTMLLLGELVHRWSGEPFDAHVRSVLFEPLGLDDCWIGMPADAHARYGDRIAGMSDTSGDEPRLLEGLLTAEGNARCVPGGGGRGPVRQLARVVELLRRGGELDGVRIVSPVAVEAMTARHRVGMLDETFGVPVDWGLGLIIDAFPYGRHCSPRTFGHGGARSSVAFCDPEHGLVVALVCNGMPAHQDHYRRQSAITSAIYEDLGLADPSDPGRDRPMPSVGLV